MGTGMIQLRVRSEYSFRRAYGPVARVVAALKELGAPAAGIVDSDGSTWGHVRWEQECNKAGVRPMFGAELIVDGVRAPMWALAERSAGDLYELTSADKLTTSVVAARTGVVMFAGGAADDPALFDYVDVNPGSPLAQRRALDLARRTGKPLVVTSDNYYPRATDADKYFALGGGEKITPQHLLTRDELRAALRVLSEEEFDRALRNVEEVAERCGNVRLPKAPLIKVEGDLRAAALEGKRRRCAEGGIERWTAEYEQRLEYELRLIAEKEFESYFLVVAEMVMWAKQRMLVGPARGSSAGSLVCYLLGITEVDPIVHKLLFERFIDVSRSDLPDIDVDFSDERRDMVFEHLAERYGAEHVARLGNVITLKPASAINQVTKRLGIPIEETFALRNVLIEYSSGDSRYGRGIEDTLENTEPGRRFLREHPEAALMTEVENHAWGSSVHAAGVVVCNDPIKRFCTVRNGVAQIAKPDAEYLGLLKVDALGLRTLGVIESAGCVDNATLYNLKLNDPEVLRIFNERKFAGIFQFEGKSQRSLAEQMRFPSFQQIDHVTALARPGPLGGGAANHYLARAAGKEPVTYRHERLRSWLEDTYGVVLYQEQVMSIVRYIGHFSWEQATATRKAMSGRKGVEFFNRQREQFLRGAAEEGLSESEADAIWNEVCTFGAWGMNRSHTVSYAIISYWCAWMKRYHTLEYAAACLRKATNDDQALDLLRELHREGIQFTPLDPDLSEVNWSVKNGKLIGGIQNAEGYGPAKAAAYVEARNAGRLTERDKQQLAAARVKFTDIFPTHARWGHLYEDPSRAGCRPGTVIKNIADLQEDEECVIIGLLVEKERRDANEAMRVKRRGGKRLSGQTQFADLRVVDDSTTTPIILRIDRFNWRTIGEPIMDKAVVGEDYFLVRGRKLRGYPMIAVEKIRCLTNPDVLRRA